MVNKRRNRRVYRPNKLIEKSFAMVVVASVLFLVAACAPSGAEEAVPVEVGLPPTEPAQVMQADTPTPEEVEIVTATPDPSAAAEATVEAADIGPIDEVTTLLGVEFPFPDGSTVELTEDESLVVVNTPYTIEEATGIAEGTMIAHGYDLISQEGSAENEIVYTFQQGEQNVILTIARSEDGESTTMQFAIGEPA